MIGFIYPRLDSGGLRAINFINVHRPVYVRLQLSIVQTVSSDIYMFWREESEQESVFDSPTFMHDHRGVTPPCVLWKEFAKTVLAFTGSKSRQNSGKYLHD